MMYFLKSNLGRLRLVGFAEGISLLLLVGIGVPLKHIYGEPGLVKIIGPIHGILFLLFVFNTLSISVEQEWKFKEVTWKVLVACMIPFGTFYIDKKILSRLKEQD
ncbi:membrane protein [Leptospira kobayashii]|uniref:Membrane protein n=1 Tax=Leptospira kobayashii TaxID=1917830 RepID=A0ABM7UJW4_9LEPT|nr:DUF3817 domain-containing protein [Leptospira kobayashii]BDA79004.1 membrane protein [Leptospira kobayashii]